MATVSKLIESALRTIGVLAANEQPTAEDMQDGLMYLQQLMASWQTESLMVRAYTRETFTLLEQRDYTIGPGMELDTIKPLQVISAYIQDPTGLQRVVTVTTRNQYDAIPIKDITKNWPSYLYFDPAGFIRFTSITVPGDLLVLTTLKPYTTEITLHADDVFPAEYERAIRLGLAMEMAPEYGKQIGQLEAAQFAQAIKGIKRINAKDRALTSEVDPALVRSRGYDIYNGPL